MATFGRLDDVDAADADADADDGDTLKYTASRTFAPRRMACAGLRQATRDDTTESGGAPLTLRVWESNDCSGTGTVLVGGEDECNADVGIWDYTDQKDKNCMAGSSLSAWAALGNIDHTGDQKTHIEFKRMLSVFIIQKLQ